jgi:hypothetical protein
MKCKWRGCACTFVVFVSVVVAYMFSNVSFLKHVRNDRSDDNEMLASATKVSKLLRKLGTQNNNVPRWLEAKPHARRITNDEHRPPTYSLNGDIDAFVNLFDVLRLIEQVLESKHLLSSGLGHLDHRRRFQMALVKMELCNRARHQL